MTLTSSTSAIMASPRTTVAIGQLSGVRHFVLFVLIPLMLLAVACAIFSKAHKRKMGDTLGIVAQVVLGLLMVGLALGGYYAFAVWAAQQATS